MCAFGKQRWLYSLFRSKRKGTKDPSLPLGRSFYCIWAWLPTAKIIWGMKKKAASGLRYHCPPLFGTVKLEALLFRARNALKKRRSPKISPWSMDAVQMEAGLKTRVVQIAWTSKVVFGGVSSLQWISICYKRTNSWGCFWSNYSDLTRPINPPNGGEK